MQCWAQILIQFMEQQPGLMHQFKTPELQSLTHGMIIWEMLQLIGKQQRIIFFILGMREALDLVVTL